MECLRNIAASYELNFLLCVLRGRKEIVVSLYIGFLCLD